MIIDNPDVALGGVTFGWLAATFNSIQHMMAKGYLERITTPMLMISAGADKIVSLAAQKKTCRRLSNCHLVMIPNALHELLIETDTVLDKFWSIFDDFVMYPITTGAVIPCALQMDCFSSKMVVQYFNRRKEG